MGSTSPLVDSTSSLVDSTSSLVDSTSPLSRLRESTSGLHELTSGLHELTSGLHELTSELHELTSGLHESTSGLHELTSGLHESTSGLHGCAALAGIGGQPRRRALSPPLRASCRRPAGEDASAPAASSRPPNELRRATASADSVHFRTARPRGRVRRAPGGPGLRSSHCFTCDELACFQVLTRVSMHGHPAVPPDLSCEVHTDARLATF